MDVEEQYKVCELIEAVITSDGVIADDERAFLRRIVERFGLPDRGPIKMAENDFGRSTATLRSLPPDVRTRVMALLVEAAVVDGRVEPQERALLLSSAATLGIEATALEERIAWRLREVPRSAPPRKAGASDAPAGGDA
ncbi:MAG: TerB family tellurite resistance protein [Deltaproteobacteria bacterium]|nr:TerB family tellurite resistance protein [Deltaproteobacteria bacterium]